MTPLTSNRENEANLAAGCPLDPASSESTSHPAIIDYVRKIEKSTCPDCLSELSKDLTNYLESIPSGRMGDYAIGLRLNCAQRQADLLHDQGRLDEAEKMLHKMLHFAWEYLEQTEHKRKAIRDRAILHGKMGKILMAKEQLSDAMEHYQIAVDLLENGNASYPDDADIMRFLALYLNRLGDIFSSLNLNEKARGVYERDLELLHKLQEIDPDNVEHKRDVAITLTRQALLHHRSQMNDLARNDLEQARKILEKIVADNPTDRQAIHDLGVVRDSLGPKPEILDQVVIYRLASEGQLLKRATFPKAPPEKK